MAASLIGLVDTGVANLGSLCEALRLLDAEMRILKDPRQVSDCRAVILPGVGAFAAGMAALDAADWKTALASAVSAGTPLLGICLGMQLLFSRSFEGGEHAGLGFVPGDVIPLEPRPGTPVPHMGWSDLEVESDSTLFAKGESRCVYFAHSFHAVPADPRCATAGFRFAGSRCVAAVQRDGILGVQFHPEKSQRDGLDVLERFLALAKGRGA